MKVYLQYRPIADSHTYNTSISSATDITIPSNADSIMISAKDNDVHYTLDGTTPTTSLGFKLIADSAPIILPLTSGTVIKVIETTASAAIDYVFLTIT